MRSTTHRINYKERHNLALNDSTDIYCNFSLNKNHKCSTAFHHKDTKSAEIGLRKNLNYEKTVALEKVSDVTEKATSHKHSISLKKSNKNLSKDYFYPNFDDAKKATENFSSSKKSCSTLSLHIAAYENFTEVQATDFLADKESQNKGSKTITALINPKQIFTSLLKDQLEFPRQQENDPIKPEVQQFSASQKLFTPLQEPFKPPVVPRPSAQIPGAQVKYKMQSIVFANVTLIDESRESSGRPLWLSLVNRASKLGFNTRVLLFIELEKDLSALIVDKQCVNYVDCIRSCKTMPELSNILESNASEIGGQKSLLVIDNLTLLARRFGIDSIAALLYSVGQICPILSRFQRNAFSDMEQNRLKSIATTILSLNKNGEDGKQICKTITAKKGGLGLREKVESYEISATGITSKSVETGLKKASASIQSSDFMPCHGGSAASTSSSRERNQREKASVILPFTRAQTEKGLVGLNANRKKPMGAKIEYFAEKCDDLEDSDPDEELMY